VYREQVDDFGCYASFLYWNSRNGVLLVASKQMGATVIAVDIVISTLNALIIVKVAKKPAKTVILLLLLHFFHLMSRIVTVLLVKQSFSVTNC
jgi:hypothetical protein